MEFTLDYYCDLYLWQDTVYLYSLFFLTCKCSYGSPLVFISDVQFINGDTGIQS